jgi:hypothetical protein
MIKTKEFLKDKSKEFAAWREKKGGTKCYSESPLIDVNVNKSGGIIKHSKFQSPIW